MLRSFGFRVQADLGPRTKQKLTKRTDTVAMLCFFFALKREKYLPNFGLRIQADKGPRAKTDKRTKTVAMLCFLL